MRRSFFFTMVLHRGSWCFTVFYSVLLRPREYAEVFGVSGTGMLNSSADLATLWGKSPLIQHRSVEFFR